MRATIRASIGGALALLLIISGAPALAQDTGEPSTAPVETPVPGSDEAESGGDTGASITEEPETGTADADAEGADADGTEPESTDDANGASTPDDTADDSDVSDGPTDAPETLDISGVILMTPNEPHHNGDEGVHTESGAGAAIATEEGPIVPIDPESVEGVLEPGATFTGTVALPDDIHDEVVDALDATVARDTPTDDEVLEAVSDVAIAAQAELPAAGALSAAPQIAQQKHLVDIAWVNGGTSPGHAALQSMVRSSSSYWSSQTGRAIDGLSITSTKSFSYADKCNFWGVWDAAARQFGRTAYDYQGRNAGRHLVVFTQSAGCGWAGMGTLGSLHSGGMVWTDVAIRPGGTAVGRAQPTLDHEFGHNFGLGHSHARQCSGTTTDSATQAKYWPDTGGTRQTPVSPCSDVEYGDHWSPMGFDNSLRTTKSPALTIPQKQALGVLPSGSLRTVSASSGLTQTISIRSADQASGLRGLKVTSPTSGGDFFVEYRSGAGQDSGAPWSNGAVWNAPNVPGSYVGTGLRVVKSYPESWSGGRELRTSVVAQNLTSGNLRGKHYTMAAGQSNTPYGSTVRITNVSSTATASTVRVEFRGFRAGGKQVTTEVVSGGAPVPGRDIRARLSGSWSTQLGTPSKVTESYQWMRNGTAISGATKSTYRLTNSDLGKKISVRVKPSASGYVTGSGSVSAAETVQASDYPTTRSRISGKDRYATAAAVSKHAFPKTSGGTAVVALGLDYPDALSAAPLAAKLGGPLLLTQKNGVPQATLNEIARLKPKRVIVVGGTGAVSDTALRQLRANGRTVERISGKDRYATSLAIMKRGWGTSAPRAFVATGTDFADALSASAAAGSVNAPVVLVPGAASSMPAATGTALRNAGVTRVSIAGGTGAVSAGIERSLKQRHTVTRFAGKNRYETSALIARAHHTARGDAYVAAGLDFPDALSGAVAAGTKKAPLVLAQQICVPRVVDSALNTVKPARIHVLGGTGVLTESVRLGSRCAS